MKRLVHESAKTVRLWLHIALLFLSSTDTRAEVTFDWAVVGNPGNADEVILSERVFGNDGFVPIISGPVGGVDYAYQISKYEVTNAQYVSFLNAVDPAANNDLSLYHPNMASGFGGIGRNLSVDFGDRYFSQPGREENPVNYVSWIDSARFINWLQNGQGSGSTESGVYTLDKSSNPLGTTEVRAADADFFLPTRDEWHKAAYHDAATGAYYNYANQSDIIPISAHPSDNPAGANYLNTTGGFLNTGENNNYAVTRSTNFPTDINPITDVGSYTSSVSPYGTFDQNGNLWEWTETSHLFAGQRFERNVQGGSWAVGGLDRDWRQLSSSYLPSAENAQVGFRIAGRVSDDDIIVPEQLLPACGEVLDNGKVVTCVESFEGGGTNGNGEFHYTVDASPDIITEEIVTTIVERVDFGLTNVPTPVSDEQLQAALEKAIPGMPYLVFELLERTVDQTIIDKIAAEVFFTNILDGGTPTAAFGIDYGGDPSNPFTWFPITPRDVSAQNIGRVEQREFVTQTTTQYFLTLPHPCDFNENGKVDFADFLMFSGVFGQSAEEAGAKFDKDSSGTVDFADFLKFSANFGTEVGSAPVPEPSNARLLIVISCFVALRRFGAINC